MTFLPLVAALTWTVALIIDNEPLGADGSLLAGVGMIALAGVSVVGMTITGARWAHRLGFVSVGTGLLVAAIRSVDAVWIVGLIASVTAGSALLMPQVTSKMRKLPAATGPPRAAVVLPLVLLAVPFVLGLVAEGSGTWPVLVPGLTAPVFAYAYARVVPGGLTGVRVGWPLLVIATAPFLEVAAASVSLSVAVAVLAIAWRGDVKAAFHPPAEKGSTYPIPPELAPDEILDAANIDDRGRKK